MSSYLYMHDSIRNTTGIGEGKGPYIAIHDGFEGLSNWAGYRESLSKIFLSLRSSSSNVGFEPLFFTFTHFLFTQPFTWLLAYSNTDTPHQSMAQTVSHSITTPTSLSTVHHSPHLKHHPAPSHH
jgi:hypothetical protein